MEKKRHSEKKKKKRHKNHPHYTQTQRSIIPPAFF